MPSFQRASSGDALFADCSLFSLLFSLSFPLARCCALLLEDERIADCERATFSFYFGAHARKTKEKEDVQPAGGGKGGVKEGKIAFGLRIDENALFLHVHFHGLEDRAHSRRWVGRRRNRGAETPADSK